jgi:hypothetical protein
MLRATMRETGAAQAARFPVLLDILFATPAAAGWPARHNTG